jgi:hypothetical protein
MLGNKWMPPWLGMMFPDLAPGDMTGAVPITPQNTLPPRNQQRDEFMYGYGTRPPGVMPDITGRPYPDLEIQRADSAPNWTSPGMPGIPPGVGPSQPPRTVVPASNPPPTKSPPMMGNAPDMSLWDATAPPASPSAPAAAARTPFDWGAESPLWYTLMSAGPAMMQPSWYGFGGQLGQGISAAAENARSGPMRRAQLDLMRAQVGKATAEASSRDMLLKLYGDKSLPMAVRLAAASGDMGKFVDAYMKLDPDTQKMIAQNEAVAAALKTGATERAKLDPGIIQGEADKAAAIEAAKTNATGGSTNLSKLYRDLSLAPPGSEKAKSIQAEIDKERAQSEKAVSDATTAKAGIERAKAAMGDFDNAEKRLYKDGKIDRNVLLNVPFTEGRTFAQELKRAASAYVFAVGGKALTATEAAFVVDPYIPSIYDTDQGIREKMKGLRKSLESFAGQTKQSGQPRMRLGADGTWQ